MARVASLSRGTRGNNELDSKRALCLTRSDARWKA
jgi:hypothetical protein